MKWRHVEGLNTNIKMGVSLEFFHKLHGSFKYICIEDDNNNNVSIIIIIIKGTTVLPPSIDDTYDFGSRK